MFPSDTAGWIGLSLGVAALVPITTICVLFIIANTKVLNEEKFLHAELDGIQRALDDIQREADRTGVDPTDEQMAALNERIDQYQRRFEIFRRSPFVIRH